MKTNIFEDRTQSEKLRKMGRKVRSHGSCRAKRHPRSPRLKK